MRLTVKKFDGCVLHPFSEKDNTVYTYIRLNTNVKHQ